MLLLSLALVALAAGPAAASGNLTNANWFQACSPVPSSSLFYSYVLTTSPTEGETSGSIVLFDPSQPSGTFPCGTPNASLSFFSLNSNQSITSTTVLWNSVPGATDPVANPSYSDVRAISLNALTVPLSLRASSTAFEAICTDLGAGAVSGSSTIYSGSCAALGLTRTSNCSSLTLTFQDSGPTSGAVLKASLPSSCAHNALDMTLLQSVPVPVTAAPTTARATTGPTLTAAPSSSSGGRFRPWHFWPLIR